MLDFSITALFSPVLIFGWGSWREDDPVNGDDGEIAMDRLSFELLMKTLWISEVKEGSQLCHGQAGCSATKSALC